MVACLSVWFLFVCLFACLLACWLFYLCVRACVCVCVCLSKRSIPHKSGCSFGFSFNHPQSILKSTQMEHHLIDLPCQQKQGQVPQKRNPLKARENPQIPSVSELRECPSNGFRFGCFPLKPQKGDTSIHRFHRQTIRTRKASKHSLPSELASMLRGKPMLF